MKRFSQFLVIAGLVSFIACGPSAKEKEAEQRKLDSLKQDSIMKAQAIQDSLYKADSIVKADSAKVADSLAKIKK
ncbi:MAG: hypothetical protein M0R21_12655 [Lentimicrobiaceae bacterium]|jgi:hypothetical protein|nr:hypothetical protein [Lentimicrobiaceae bacterium]